MVPYTKYTFQLGLNSERAWLRRTTKTLRSACRLAIRARWVGGMKIMESNLLCEKVTIVAKFALALNQSSTVEASKISSRGKAVFTMDRGKLCMGRPTRVLRSWTTMSGVGVHTVWRAHNRKYGKVKASPQRYQQQEGVEDEELGGNDQSSSHN